MSRMKRLYEEFSSVLKNVGIQNGDMLYIASDITQLILDATKCIDINKENERNIFLHGIVNSIQQIIGREGTILFPVFSWSFCRDNYFDYCETDGETGAFSNWVRVNRSDFYRTKHPIYSFMVWGKYTDYFHSMDNQESWGMDSPFAYMHKMNAKLMLLNVSLQRGFTFMHYVEQCLEVPYRYHKYFIGEYKDEKGTVTKRCYSMYVRDLSISMEENLPDSFAEKEMNAQKAEFLNSTIKLIDLRKAFCAVENDFKQNNGKNCYRFDGYTIDWREGNTHNDEICYGISRRYCKKIP